MRKQKKNNGLHIIIVGCGKVGKELTHHLSDDGNDITIIDTDAERVNVTSLQYDVMGIVGNGASYSTLQEADLEHADILIAVTQSDEVNLLCCVIARKAANCHTIARVRNPIYSEEREFLKKEFGLSMTINPEDTAAAEIDRLLLFPSATDIDTFAKGRISMIRVKVPEGSPIAGAALRSLPPHISGNMLVCIARRGDEVIIPDGSFQIREGDELALICRMDEANRIFSQIGARLDRVANVMIVGGGKMTYYLSKRLISRGVKVKIIEMDRNRCEELCNLLPQATVICGDGAEEDLLKEEHLEQMDAFVAGTGIDETNIILSLYAKKMVHSKVVTKMARMDFDAVVGGLDLDSVIYPKHLTAESILQYVRAMRNSVGIAVETLYRFMDDRVEALEFVIKPGTPMLGVPFADLKLKKNLLIGGIFRKGRLIIPGGQDHFEPEDSVIVVTTHQGFQDFRDILA